MVENELAVRSEKMSLEGVSRAFEALMVSGKIDEQAELLALINELYADAECRCEEKEASYGDDSEEAMACALAVNRGRQGMLDAYKSFLTKIKRE